jgi:iron complex outermembrane receptor protein
VSGSFVDRQRRYDEDADFAPPPPSYVTLGAEAGIAVPLGRQRLAFSLVGRNLTNARYRDYTSLVRYYADEPGWDLMLRVSLDFAAGPLGE